MRVSQGAVPSRRIDLRSDAANYLSNVLPHELCHVLLADEFPDGEPPLWYDEGIALLADTPAKQSLHHRDVAEGLRRGEQFPLTEILAARRYPQNRLGVFYGQCASLTHLLLRSGPPERVHKFAKRFQEIGVNLALNECYGIAGIAELEREWRTTVDSDSSAALAPYLPLPSPDNSQDRAAVE